MNEAPPTVICFGEMLWDVLPAGIFAGGAPFNVAYHLRQLGLRPHLATAVGRDLLGDELLRRLKHWDMDSLGVARHLGLPTGTVSASLSPAGEASYEVATEVAWDQIATGEDTLRAAVQARAFVFGSLAMRTTFNQAALDRLLAVLPPDAMRVFDVNLRPPHDRLSLVRELAAKATFLKLNSAEAVRLAGCATDEANARRLATQIGCAQVCITAAERGAGLLHDDRWSWEPARPVAVVDAVGTGDAFLAALLAQRLHGTAWEEALARACRLGEWVATQYGATPPYTAATPR